MMIIGNWFFQLPFKLSEVKCLSQKSMTKVKCTSCGKDCEVPFKPTPGKPVYCRECFAERRARPQQRSESGSSNFEPKHAWARRRKTSPVQIDEDRSKSLHKFSHAP
jgi:CxxC-x17-CxxC domain-containing protein